ncbi:MAG: Sensor histidine kinase TodS [Chroococcidiopsis sp. SAG 2025]|uniref:response regulator n=1 Tax=Chroococcidiopsis sp. SAG 2025 TaxID=171389 RepID=UPI0029373BAE|nr:response regulator [Chroococcidiopsis sp. SAG 2025]MDV2995828.1 Sensor histidine kinase TodS [Chroococcidiopsis sp. SAG 2025]
MKSESKINVLLVDDYPENLVALEATLNSLGQNLVKAYSGKQALKCLLEQDFAVILLDVQMPEMDGFETASLIRQRERSRHTPIIFLTAISDSDDLKSKGYALGAVDYLLKPIDPIILTSKVAVFVELFKKNLEVKRQAAQLVAKNLEIFQAQAARQQAEAANLMKDEFLAVVSHELRSPLNSILGWSQLMQMRKFDEAKLCQALKIIERNAKSQAQLIDDILDMSRLMRGKVQLSIQPVNAIATIELLLESIRPQLEEKSLQLHTHLDPAAQTIAADPARLRQIIWNLLSNAVKFTPEKGQIEIRLSQESREQGAGSREQGSRGAEEQGSRKVTTVNYQRPTTNYQLPTTNYQLPITTYAQIQVIDTGIGIRPEFLPQIFDRFRQADSSITRAFGGLGLGLAIVRQLVILHGGTIEAHSEGEGKGTTFTVRLPLANSPSTATSSSTGTPNLINLIANDESKLNSLLDGVNVLVVEDNNDSRDFIKFALEQAGATVTTVSSAADAVAYLERDRPDVLISDIAMPETDGYQFIQQLRATEQPGDKYIPAIALTAHAKPEDRSRSLAAGFQQHITKPVESTALIAAVAELIKQQSVVSSQ